MFIVLAVIGAALVVPSPLSPAQSSQPSVAVAPYREGVIGHPSSVNPITPRSQADQDLVALLFRGLTKAGPNGSVVPDLATWTASTDGRSYTFQIRSDAYWEDGQPVTAADVVYTVGLVQDASYDGPVGSSWQGVRVSAQGSSTVQVTMTLPIAGFLRQAELLILPSHLLKGTSVAELADSSYSARPIGDGPYRIAELDYNHAVLKRVAAVTEAPLTNPSSQASAGSTASASAISFATATPRKPAAPTATPAPTPTPTPSRSPSPTPAPTPSPTATPDLSGFVLSGISTIDVTFYDDSASAAADFTSGKLDVVSGLTPQQTDAALMTAGSRLVAYHWASLLSVVVNQRSTHPELRDPSARTGLLSAIDRNALLSQVLEGRGSYAQMPIPSWSYAYDVSSVTTTPYDVTEAAGYLATAGWTHTAAGWTAPKGTTTYTMELLTLDKATNPVVYATAQVVAADWTALGIPVQVDAVTTSAYLDRLDSGDFSSAIVDFDIGLDPDLGPMLLSSQIGAGGSNVSGLQDPTLDQLLLTVRKTADPGARQSAVSALEKYISTTIPVLPLAFRDYDMAVAKRIQGVAANEISDPSGRFWDVIDWRLASAR
jgi:ABC-type transport system substrate-binding protein